MSYKITIHITNTLANRTYRIVEAANHSNSGGGTWTTSTAGLITLTMPGSGTSGMLRFMADDGDTDDVFVVVTGIHNYKPWLDIVAIVPGGATCVSLLPEYYGRGVRAFAREKCMVVHRAVGKGREVGAEFEGVGKGKEREKELVVRVMVKGV